MKSLVLTVFVLLFSTACNKQQYGQCAAPNDHLRVMYKSASSLNPFSHAFCILCNPTLEPNDYSTWAREMGATSPPNSPDGFHPCLYVYDPTRSEEGIDTLNMCVRLACDGEGDFSDMVSESNGNFDLSSILER